MKLNLEDFVLNMDIKGTVDMNTFDHAEKTSLIDDILTRQNSKFIFIWSGISTGNAQLRVVGKTEEGVINLKLLAIHVGVEVGTMYQRAYQLGEEIVIIDETQYYIDVDVLPRNQMR